MNQQAETNSKVTKGFDRASKNPSLEANSPEEHKEDFVTKAVENETSKIPSIAFLSFAMGSMALALGLAVKSERKGWANFVGLWAPTFLLLGIYNKIVKTHGSDMQQSMR